jgi:hypothetical protein
VRWVKGFTYIKGETFIPEKINFKIGLKKGIL